MVESHEFVEEVLVLNQTVGHFQLNVWYTSKHEYFIQVTNLSTEKVKDSTKPATYQPVFGIDQADLQMILAEAEALCEQFEEEDQNGNN